MTVKTLKTINGEIIIGEIINETKDTYTIKSAAVLIVKKDQDGNLAISLGYYMPHVINDTIDLRVSCVAAEGIPTEDLVAEYNRIFGSGLVIARANELPK